MTTTILIVDDNPLNIEILKQYLDDEEYNIVSFTSAEDTLDYLTKGGKADLILLDRIMPNMDGMELLSAIKSTSELNHIPVIMQTMATGDKEIEEGVDAGAYFYLTKPYSKKMILSVVKSTLQHFKNQFSAKEELDNIAGISANLSQASFTFRTLEEARSIAQFLAPCFPNASLALMGLLELSINAIEHGNLGIGYDDKTHLIDEGRWEEEIARRLESPQYQANYATLDFSADRSHVQAIITDMGKGFDYDNYRELDASSLLAGHGRGIAITRMQSFDELEYIPPGNSVKCISYFK